MAGVDPYEVPVGETPAQKRERLMHLTDENWKPGDDPLMPPTPAEAIVEEVMTPSSPVAESEPVPPSRTRRPRAKPEEGAGAGDAA